MDEPRGNSAAPEGSKKKRNKAVKTLVWILVVLFLIAGSVFSRRYADSGGAPPAAVPATVVLAGLEIPRSVLNACAITAAIIALAAIVRIVAVPRLRHRPGAMQNALEAAVETAGRASKGRMRRLARRLAPFMPVILALVGLCLAVGFAIKLIFPHAQHEELSVSLGSPPVLVFGLEVPQSVLYTWCIMAVLIIAALALRIFAVPRFSDRPGVLQNALEAAIDAAEGFTASHVHSLTKGLAPYVFTVAVYIVCSAMTELLGLRPPTTDITVTFALSIITFVMINYYGIKCNGIKGRAKQFVKPMAFMIPFKILSDVAVPISLACRLFGNMLGGMIVMNLLYMALGNFSVGVPAVLGLYFNLFHPLIQTFIFLKLSLSFIEEAVEG